MGWSDKGVSGVKPENRVQWFECAVSDSAARSVRLENKVGKRKES